jgi:hypothetical protein
LEAKDFIISIYCCVCSSRKCIRCCQKAILRKAVCWSVQVCHSPSPESVEAVQRIIGNTSQCEQQPGADIELLVVSQTATGGHTFNFYAMLSGFRLVISSLLREIILQLNFFNVFNKTYKYSIYIFCKTVQIKYFLSSNQTSLIILLFNFIQ